jgi:hypothetical protein
MHPAPACLPARCSAPHSASLFDFGLFFFHNARESVSRGSGPYFYLPKMESHLEARLWNDAFNLAQGECKQLELQHAGKDQGCSFKKVQAGRASVCVRRESLLEGVYIPA